MRSIMIDNGIHERLKKACVHAGISIKELSESAISRAISEYEKSPPVSEGEISLRSDITGEEELAFRDRVFEEVMEALPANSERFSIRTVRQLLYGKKRV